MARNGSGTYNLPVGNPVTSGTLVEAAWANSTLSDIAAALTNSISSDGQTVPTANLPMGGFRFTNLGAATAATHSVIASQVQKSELIKVGAVAGGPVAFTGTLPLATVVFTAGMLLTFTPNVDGDPSPTLAINGGTANAIVGPDGAALIAGQLPTGVPQLLSWDGANWRLISPASGYFLPLTGGRVDGKIGLNRDAVYELDISGTVQILSVGTNIITGDTANPALTVSNAGAGYALTTDGDVELTGALRAITAAGGPTFTTGSGLEFSYSGTTGSITSYNQDTSLHTDLTINGAAVQIYGNGNDTNLSIGMDGVPYIKIADGGNVGIGANVTANDVLHIKGNTRIDTAGINGGVQLYNGTDWIGRFVRANAGNAFAAGTAANDIVIGTVATNKIFFDTNAGSGTPALVIGAANGTVEIGSSLKFVTSGARITGDFSNATVNSRILFKSSTTDGNTVVGAVPNGTSVTSGFQLYNNSDVTAALGYLDIRSGSAAHSINSGSLNAGATLPIRVVVGSSTTEFSSDGKVTFRPPASVTPANNGDLSFQITSNTQLTFKLKGSDGTVRSGNIALA